MFMSLSSGITGLAVAFSRGWLMSVALFALLPLMVGASNFIIKAASSNILINMKLYSQSAGYAEQALNAIRVVTAFGMQKQESTNYTKYLDRAKASAIRTNFSTGIGIGMMLFSVYLSYAYAFWIGSILVQKQVVNDNTGEPYTVQDILICFFCITMSFFTIGMIGPNFKIIGEAKAAGGLAFKVIEREPVMKIDEGNALENMRGSIEFKNVTFAYPTRKDQNALEDFSAIFEKGKTTALVGPSGSGKSTVV